MFKGKKVIAASLAAAVTLGAMGGLAACAGNDTYDVAIFAYKYDDSYITLVREAITTKLNEIKGDRKIAFTIYNGQGEQATQSTQIDTAITAGADLLVVNAVDYSASGDTIAQKAKANKLPIIFFNREVPDSSVAENNAIFIGTDPDAPGYMIGEMINELITDQAAFEKYDRNSDGRLGYVMLRAEVGNAEANGRTLYAIKEGDKLLTAKKTAGTLTGVTGSAINTTMSGETVSLNVLKRVGEDLVADWDSSKAQTQMSSIWSSSAAEIDFVIANNDDMALGAITSLQANGFNKAKSKTDDPTKYIPVYGVDALATAVEKINNGEMQGTVKQDADAMAACIVKMITQVQDGKTGSALVEGTDYVFDSDASKIRIPYSKVG